MRRVGGAAKSNPNASYLFTAWGQFLTHDIIQTPDVGKGEVPCDCNENKRLNMLYSRVRLGSI